jgi:glucuronate isomerase
MMPLDPARLFDPDPTQKSAAMYLYELVAKKPIYSPHGHVNPAFFSNPNYHFKNPVELFIQPDHYVIRMLYSQGITYDRILTSENPRAVWQLFASNYFLYRGTPSGIWLDHEMWEVFGVKEKLTGDSADRIYDQIVHMLAGEEFTPRNLYKKFSIAVLATTDSATDTLEHHQAILNSGWDGRIIPTFRPDNLINLNASDWIQNIHLLEKVSGIQIGSYKEFIQALEQRRSYFKSMGATASDVSPAQPITAWLSPNEMEVIFQRALQGKSAPPDAVNFSAHMLIELARMCVEDGLVMQIHPAIYRNHNPQVMKEFGPDTGFDIPVRTEFTRQLKPLLDRFGNHPNLTLILFNLDESALPRELAPLAGAYPAIKLGPPWWFLDSWNGMRRYFDQVMETTGIYNTVGFNDDTRGLLSIPARHDVWRRASANWLAGLLVRGIIDREDAETMIHELTDGLVKKAYHI